MGKRQRIAEIHSRIVDALAPLAPGGVAVKVRLGFAGAGWITDPTLGGPSIEVRYLQLEVPANWIETVADQGLTLVESELVLYAQPTCPINTPAGCDGCWTVLASRWMEGRRRASEDGPSPRAAFVVKYGGELVLAETPESGMNRLLCKFEWGLAGPGSREELPDF